MFLVGIPLYELRIWGIYILAIGFWVIVTSTKSQTVGSSLKSAAWLPLPCDTWHRSFHSDGNSHSFHPDVSQPQFYPADVPPHPDPADVPPNPDISHPDLADVPPSPDISHPVHATGWERMTIQLPRIDMSGYSGDAYLDSLARQTLAIRRIHFCPQ